MNINVNIGLKNQVLLELQSKVCRKQSDAKLKHKHLNLVREQRGLHSHHYCNQGHYMGKRDYLFRDNKNNQVKRKKAAGSNNLECDKI